MTGHHSSRLGEAVKDGAGEQGGEEVAASLRRPEVMIIMIIIMIITIILIMIIIIINMPIAAICLTITIKFQKIQKICHVHLKNICVSETFVEAPLLAFWPACQPRRQCGDSDSGNSYDVYVEID